MDLAAVSLAENATYYLCGPVPFMQAVRSSLIDRDVAAHGSAPGLVDTRGLQ
jgi:nitric oxide dioxygenase